MNAAHNIHYAQVLLGIPATRIANLSAILERRKILSLPEAIETLATTKNKLVLQYNTMSPDARVLIIMSHGEGSTYHWRTDVADVGVQDLKASISTLEKTCSKIGADCLLELQGSLPTLKQISDVFVRGSQIPEVIKALDEILPQRTFDPFNL